MLLVKTYIAPSKIHGMGLFAGEFIAKGTETWVLDMRIDYLLSEEEIAALPVGVQEQIDRYAYVRRDGIHVLCGDDARFFNHSDLPNISSDPQDDAPDVALRDIHPGEELFCDYRIFDHNWQRILASENPPFSDEGPK